MGIIKLKPLVVSIAIPMLLGFLSSFLNPNSSAYYMSLNLPSFAPPSSIFGIVWPILYFLMGIAFYRVWVSYAPKSLKKIAAVLFFSQLILNFLFPFVLFKFDMILPALIILIILVILNLILVYVFYKIDKKSAFLMLPYLFWLIFASFLMFSIFKIN